MDSRKAFEKELKDVDTVFHELESTIKDPVRLSEAVLSGEALLRSALEQKLGLSLTERQSAVLRLIASGCSIKEIATALDISVRTAEFHRAAVMNRLKLRSTAMLTRFALTAGML